MSYWIVVFMSCSFNKYLVCKSDYVRQIYETKRECEQANTSLFVKGSCLKVDLNPDHFGEI